MTSQWLLVWMLPTVNDPTLKSLHTFKKKSSSRPRMLLIKWLFSYSSEVFVDKWPTLAANQCTSQQTAVIASYWRTLYARDTLTPNPAKLVLSYGSHAPLSVTVPCCPSGASCNCFWHFPFVPFNPALICSGHSINAESSQPDIKLRRLSKRCVNDTPCSPVPSRDFGPCSRTRECEDVHEERM